MQEDASLWFREELGPRAWIGKPSSDEALPPAGDGVESSAPGLLREGEPAPLH